MGPVPCPYFGLFSIAEFTYLIPRSQAFLIVFPHDKKVVIALDRVHPVSYTHLRAHETV